MRTHGSTTYAAPRMPLMTVNEVATLLGVSRGVIYRLVARSELQPYRVGARLRFRPEDVDEYLERTRETSP